MKTVLVVDDMPTDRQLMGSVVQESGHRAEFACDGQEAFVKAKALKPALILMDVVMPGEDGFRTCRNLRRDAETHDIPVVLVTSRSGTSDEIWAMRQGASEYLIKPFSPDALQAILRRYL
jgi:twitching motility two-component system response regulator PilH